MSQELQLQETCFENIKKLCSNYYKDSQTRKTDSYLTTRLSSLEDQWKDFENRHGILLQCYEDKSINYFAEDVFGKTKALYEKTKTSIEALLKLRSEESTKPVVFDLSDLNVEDTNEKLQQLLLKQECNFKAIDRVMSRIDVSQLFERWELENKLSILKTKWEAVDSQHWELEAYLKGNNREYATLYNKMEDKYELLQKQLNKKISTNAHYDSLAPKVEIPEFSGNYTQWISFKDLFEETIHKNPRINNAQKMQHLKTKLKGEASKLVQHLPISNENYTACWDILSQRFDNRRLQFTAYLNTMMSIPVIQQPDDVNLKRMHDVIQECLNGLSNIGVETDAPGLGSIFTHLMSQKLDDMTFDEYSKELREPRELPDITEFLQFLESKFMAYETKKKLKKQQPTDGKSNPEKTNFYKPKKPNSENRNSFNRAYIATYGKKPSCPYCEDNHVLMQCAKFVEMDVGQRNALVARLKLCKNCLFSHGSNECRSTKHCKECNMNHHSLLHNNNWVKNKVTETGNTNSTQASSSKNQQSVNHLCNDDVEVLLTTAQIRVQSVDGTWVTLRALLDQGSQVNLITENAAQLLRLPRRRINATISGLGAVSGESKGHLQLNCQSIHSDYAFKVDVMVMRKLTNHLPGISFEKRNWPHLENLKLADPEFNVSRPIDLLLGADVYSDVIMDGILKTDNRSPIAQHTHLGWILCGKLRTLNCHVTLVNIEDMTRFWETEDISQGTQDISNNDQCEQYYIDTVQRANDGKYIVSMPFCSNFEEKLGNSRSIAVSQFLQLEKRLQRKEKLGKMYKEFIKEYIELGHMKLSTPSLNLHLQCYLPHHGVLREQAETTKLRVVFNASQKTSSGHSLNNLQEKGSNLQKDIQALIIKWRSYKYAFTADIEKMYRCIWIDEKQQKLQKIIWRDTPTQPLREYELCTVTYGTKSAPWLALRTLLQLANDYGNKYPVASKILKNEFFVDDLVSGHNSLQEALELQKSLIDLLKEGGMNLRKWSSNHPDLLKNLSEDQISKKKLFDFKTEDSTKTLGLGWSPNLDSFFFNWELEQISNDEQLTKRKLLSEISQLYDPLGWFSPITVTAKLLFQRVWMANLGWNDTLPADIQTEWKRFKTELPETKKIKLNRWIGGTSDIELLGFCDASEKAYACVIYTRIKDRHDNYVITLLASKTRVAPLSQKTTLPRLELCGALLLSQLMEKTIRALADRNLTVRAWCDSQVVLAWLKGEQSRWEKYVANRVQAIKRIIPSEQWHYVKSEHNPADCASRGIFPSKLIKFDLWWNGPELLSQPAKYDELTTTCLHVTNLGQVKSTETNTKSKVENEHFIGQLLRKHSSLTHITRVTAWVMRFSANARNKQHDTTYLTASELMRANEIITKYAQQTEFELEYKQLLKNGTVNNKSLLSNLNPYVDENGIMRVGGRLDKSNLPSETKNPAILSRNGQLTQLIIRQAHLKTLHGGSRLTLAHIRQRYWIISGNKTVKAQLRSCVTCHRLKNTNNHQLMGQLPQQRVTPSRPFTHTGVDFTGYVDVKLNKGRGVKTSKGYIAIFVCMTTKAVHIELVSDLTSEAFIAAFQRLCARRGTPKHMYSDCGTNFIGAARKLRNEFEEFKQIITPKFFGDIAQMEVEWHFNAPAWPSAGGLWEAAVKSMKHHLHRVLGDQKMTYEELSTLITQIEACLNSRPLCPLTENPEEFYNYLTPGHFLTGSATMTLPLSDQSDLKNINIRRRWQLTEHMMQRFWKTWSTDYLHQLQTRSKWHKPTTNIKIGDVVMVKEDNLPPGKWAMGRVLELHPGADGYVRVTTLKTKTGIIKRPIVKLSPLPIENIELSEDKKQELQKDVIQKRIRKQNSKITGSKTSAILMCLLTFTVLITGSHSVNMTSKAHITNIEAGRTVYYDTVTRIQMIHDEWTLLMYYNLSNYWSGMQRAETYLHQINSLCLKTDPRYCNTTVNQLYHEMQLLNHYNEILLAPHKHLSERKKRGLINGVGNIANGLFGILDNRFAEKYTEDIESLQSNQKYLLELIKNQTSIVEIENDILKKTENNIKQELTLINNYMKQTDENFMKIESAMEAIMATSYFNSASLSAFLLINNLRRIQEMFFETLTNVYKGHLDTQLISPITLINQLNEISGHLPKTLALPIDDVRRDIKDLYRLIYLKARVTPSYFLFEVHIPLVTDDDFVLHQVIPIPVITGKETTIAKISSNYIAVDMRKNIFISLSEMDLQQCTQTQSKKLICLKNAPVYNINNNNAPCEAKLLGHHRNSTCEMRRTVCSDDWIELHSPNAWLAICCDVCPLRIICADDITTHVMTSSGIVNLAQGCIVQSQSITIHSHNIYNSNIKLGLDLDVPPVNPINNIVNLQTYHGPQLSLSESESSELKEVGKQLKTQKEREFLPSTTSLHDVHQFIILYILVGVVTATPIAWYIKKRCFAHGNSNASKPYEGIELQPRVAPPKPKRQPELAVGAATTSLNIENQTQAAPPPQKIIPSYNPVFNINE